MAIDPKRLQAKIDAQKKNNRQKIDYSKFIFTPVEGKTYNIRIVPSKIDPSWPFQEMKFTNNGLNLRYPVVALADDIDPVILASNKLKKSSDEEERKLGYSLQAKTRYFVPIIVRGEEDKGVRLLAYGKDVDNQFLDICADEDNGDIADIKEGSDIKLTTEKAPMGNGSMYNKIKLTIRKKTSVLSEDPAQIKEWLENQPDARDLYEVKTVEEIKELLLERIDAIETSDDELPEPKKKPTQQSDDSDDDDSDDDEEETDEDEEESDDTTGGLDKLFGKTAEPVTEEEPKSKTKKSDKFNKLFE